MNAGSLFDDPIRHRVAAPITGRQACLDPCAYDERSMIDALAGTCAAEEADHHRGNAFTKLDESS
jgi:hypothetical protein